MAAHLLLPITLSQETLVILMVAAFIYLAAHLLLGGVMAVILAILILSVVILLVLPLPIKFIPMHTLSITFAIAVRDVPPKKM